MLVCWNGGRTEGQSVGRLVKLLWSSVSLSISQPRQSQARQAGEGRQKRTKKEQTGKKVYITKVIIPCAKCQDFKTYQSGREWGDGKRESRVR